MAIYLTKSPYLKKDKEKSIARKKKELKEYCYNKGYNYKKICFENGI